MPTGDEYRRAAYDLKALAEDVPQAFATVDRNWDDAVQGGQLALTIEAAIDASRGLTTSIVGALESIADQCARRAAICDDYDSKLRAYRDKLNSPTGNPTSLQKPEPPAAWVTPSVQI